MVRLSLHQRTIAIALVSGVAILGFAAWSISELGHFVGQNLNDQLDTQITVLERSLGPDMRLDRGRIVTLPGFDAPRDGWSWQVTTSAGSWSTGTPYRNVALDHYVRSGRYDMYLGHGWSPDGIELHLRKREYVVPQGKVSIIATAPRRIVRQPLREALTPLLASLAAIALGLGGAALAQLRYGLRPVRALRDAVARVRTGGSDRLPEAQPAELRPLAQEVNALIAQNEAGLVHARNHVANLAHGLKTPLATLSLQLELDGASPESRALVEQIGSRVAHHLRRARSAAAGAGERARADLGATLDDLIATLTHLNGERSPTVANRVSATHVIAVDPEDLGEMLGNLIENAFRHAAGQVVIDHRQLAAWSIVTIDDNGPGIKQADLTLALQPGTRLDESGQGYGFGLGIVRELAEMYGGNLALEKSPGLGGLRAALTLPRR
jgi:signal transduction histidine kinase